MAHLLADWIFTEDYVKQGSAESDSMILRDAAGNGNDLEMRVYGDAHAPALQKALSWNRENRSLRFDSHKAQGAGKYFVTAADAPVNALGFLEGYTLEVELKLPPAGTFDPWMGILTRQGTGEQAGRTQGEKEILAGLGFNDSFQWTWYPVQAPEGRNYTCWSCCADELLLDSFIHLSIRSDGKHTRMYLNGVTDIRNPSQELAGIAAVPGRGWNVGAAFWNDSLDSFFSGEIRRIRIYDGDNGGSSMPKEYGSRLFELQGSNQPQPLTDGGPAIAVIPDSQYMGQYRPEMVECMIRFLAQNRCALHLAAMLHVGDISEESAEAEFQNADAAFQAADKAGLPYLATPGNHDYRGEGANYARYFGPARFADKEGVVFDSASLSSAMTVALCGAQVLVVSVDSYRIDPALEWARRIIGEAGKPAIVFTHDVFELADPSRTDLQLSETGALLWEKLVEHSDDVFMVIGGHYFGIGHGVASNARGRQVLQLLINYQAYPNAGNGWIQFLEFDEPHACVRARTFSPWVQERGPESCYDFAYLTSARDAFTLPFDFARLRGDGK